MKMTIALLLGAVLFGTVGAATTSSQAPVRIANCVATNARSSVAFSGGDGLAPLTEPATPAMVVVDYANISSRPITMVDFGVVKDGKLVTMVRDTGRFSPRASIMHAFAIVDGAAPRGHESTGCVPLKVQYADGSTWQNASPPRP